uniref:microtubule-associated tumor suppressor candidate 2-like n=1 Tax=Oncorhynchus gorbuscha TaxID=8017 RepID=UPI001EAEAC0B|nr:microtubule-associated tumor suppressor candidate 2-like [Oncorhynchus gorbuscha]
MKRELKFLLVALCNLRNHLQGSLRRKIEGHTPGYSSQQNGLSCGPSGLDFKQFEKMLKQDDAFGSAATLCSHLEKPIKTEYSSPDYARAKADGSQPEPAAAQPSSPITTSSHQAQAGGEEDQGPVGTRSHSSSSFPQDKLSQPGLNGLRGYPKTSIGQSGKGINNCLFKPNGHNTSSHLDMKVLSNKPMLHFSPKASQQPSTMAVHNYQNPQQQRPMSGPPHLQPKSLAQRTPLSQHGAGPGLHFKLAQQRQPEQPPAPNAPALHRRSVLPPARVSPTVRGRPADRGGSGSGVGGQECERALVQKLRERCEDQARQLQSLQAELKRASLGLEVFAITTQHFCHKSESAILKERELSLELARIRDEVASSVSRWEILQQDKGELERRFERELEGLRAQQQSELGRLEERLRQYHSLEIQRLEAQRQEQLERLRTQQLEQMEEVTENHEEALTEMENNHNDTLVTLKEEHARTVKNLKMAHEQQRKSLEEDFEKLRLSLQDQVDTLTFQNRSLRDRAKRFEEALRRSTDEQIVDALAPYQHIEEDLKSLKEVLLMKNQQIHEQDVKISELERMAQKNVFLEERVQMLQQQNEDLRARIDKNLAMSRQLSEENANLQESMEKESNEKKRLSRNNEELLWRLQSPHMSPTGSPIHRGSPILHSSNTSSPGHHRSSAGPGSPARPHSYHQ